MEKTFQVNSRHLLCRYHSHGSPTVVFEAGMGDGSDSWQEMQIQISQLTSTFAYDRAGVGRSESTSSPRTILEIVEDLAELLEFAQLPLPLILVGHSFGGLVTRLYASLFPEQVVGLILVDPACEYKEQAYADCLSADLAQLNREYLENPDLNSEKIDKVRSYQQVEQDQVDFDFPIQILTRGLPDCYGTDWPEEAILHVEQELQRNLQRLSKTSQVLLASKSGHYIHHDEPELVRKAITQLVDQVRLSK